jgi:hypothetical protein
VCTGKVDGGKVETEKVETDAVETDQVQEDAASVYRYTTRMRERGECWLVHYERTK